MGSFTLTGRHSFERDPAALYRDVADPHRQADWNTLYESVKASEPFVVADGARFSGVFKGFGAVEVRVEDVSELAFTHVAPLRMLGFCLGAFRHSYVVSSDPHEPVSTLTQTVRVSTTGAGRLLTGVFKRAFGDRMPESFEELNRYIGPPHAPNAAA